MCSPLIAELNLICREAYIIGKVCNFAWQICKVMKIKGIVVTGKALGRKLGFPTANIEVSEEVATPNGVYAVRACIDGNIYRGMANLGVRPSVSGDQHRFLEANIFDFQGDLYGKAIEVELLNYIRPEEKFGSVEQLREAIAIDRIQIEQYFADTQEGLTATRDLTQK